MDLLLRPNSQLTRARTCQASCLGAAHPNTANVIDTTKCAEKCDQGDGSKEDSDKFSACVQSCIANHFPTSQTVAPAAGASAGASGASNAANPTGSAGEPIYNSEY
jgi:hypothetical protein